MTFTSPREGKGSQGDSQDLPPKNINRKSSSAKESQPSSTSVSHTSASQASHSKSTNGNGTRSRSKRAINDAHQSLSSLLNPPADPSQPQIISPSGASRNHTRGRVAAPTPNKPSGSSHISGGPGQLIEGNVISPADTNVTSAPLDKLLAVIPGKQPLYEDGGVHAVPQSRIQLGLARAAEHAQTARDRVGLLINTPEGQGALGHLQDADSIALYTSRRLASQWVARYATHLVILALVLGLVAFGGFKALTTPSTAFQNMQAVDAYAGTDYGDEGSGGANDMDSQDFNLALPRTELGGADAAANSRVYQPQAGQPDSSAGANAAPGTQANPASPVRTDVTAYTVAQGDTIETIADKFSVMPETVMGSNGIFDVQEELAPGRVLQVPPIDGMYYVPKQGDTLDSIARHFLADPAVITTYAPNNLADGTLKPGQPIVVPGGMMPQRDTTITYTVRKGDRLKDIAARFAIDTPTLLHANSIPDPKSLQPGSQLRVLPTSGMEYKVQKGDTIFSIADKFGVSTQMILDFAPNSLSADSPLQAGQTIMVPAAIPPDQVVAAARIQPNSGNANQQPDRQPGHSAQQPQSNSDNSSKSSNSTQSSVAAKPAAVVKAQVQVHTDSVNVSSYRGGGALSWPLNNFVITQPFWARHNGIDLAAPAGTPIHAADSGKVIWAGWRTDGLGYCVFIDHLDGLLTVYGHMIRQPAVYVGQYVGRGQVIGYVGSTGHSTGPHTHFMVKVGSGRNYRNPLGYLGGR